MRFTGKLKTWDEARGFGFITPDEGGQDIFVHVSQLPHGRRPSLDTTLSFEVALNAQGKKKAVNVCPAHVLPASDRLAASSGRPRREPSSHGLSARIVIMAIVASLGWFGYRQYEQRVLSLKPAPTQAGGQLLRSAAPAPSLFSCDGRTYCSQMTSCAEATYFLENCPGAQMDGNRDGVPCEQQWCR